MTDFTCRLFRIAVAKRDSGTSEKTTKFLLTQSVVYESVEVRVSDVRCFNHKTIFMLACEVDYEDRNCLKYE